MQSLATSTWFKICPLVRARGRGRATLDVACLRHLRLGGTARKKMGKTLLGSGGQKWCVWVSSSTGFLGHLSESDIKQRESRLARIFIFEALLSFFFLALTIFIYRKKLPAFPYDAHFLFMRQRELVENEWRFFYPESIGES